MKFKVYILYSINHNKFYIGQTSNIEQRMIQHNSTSVNSYTAKFRPWVLTISLDTKTRAHAMKIEKYLKKKPREFIKRVIDEADLQKYILEKFE